MNRTRNHQIDQDKPNSERQRLHFFFHMQNLDLNNTNNNNYNIDMSVKGRQMGVEPVGEGDGVTMIKVHYM
jgi:hypothetical protein